VIATLLALALASEPISVLEDVDLAQLEAFALEGPQVGQRQAELQAARRGVTGAQLTPIQGLNVGTGLVEGDEPGQGPQLAATLWLSINAIDLVAYPNRVRVAKARKTAAAEVLRAEERAVVQEVRLLVNVLRRNESELRLAEQAVAGLEIQVEAAQQLFLSSQLGLEQLTQVEGQLLAARRSVLAARFAFEQALVSLEVLTGHPLADARRGGGP
jgi:outer membrane protein TolC